MTTELKDPLLQRATKLRGDLRRTIAEIDLLLRKAEDQLKNSGAKPKDPEKRLFDGWGAPPRSDAD